MDRFLICLFVLIGYSVNSQKTPYFLTNFYFQDAIGNLDSIEIGFDRNANLYGNPDFGEITNLSPFDSVFDVRVVNYFEYYNTIPPKLPLNLLSGRIVGGMDTIVNAPCNGTPFLVFFIHAKYQPISISVKSVSVFQKIDCPGKNNTWNFFSPDRSYHFVEPWKWASIPGVRYGCLRDSIYTLYLDKAHQTQGEMVRPYLLKYDVLGKGLDSILGVCFIRDQTFFECDSTYISSENSFNKYDFNLFPNPFTNYIEIQTDVLNQPINYEIISQTGHIINKALWPLKHEHYTINVEELQEGAYYFRLNYKVGRKVKLIIKM